jgi:hypothetical protein
MSQNPLVDSGEKSSKKTGLKPPLAAALASLEVQLDQELTRYRRTRTGYRTFSQPRVGISTSSKYQQLTAIHPTRDTTTSPLEDSLQKFGLATPKTSTPSVDQELLVTPETKINTPKSVPETQYQVLTSATAPDTLLQGQAIHPFPQKHNTCHLIKQHQLTLSKDKPFQRPTPVSCLQKLRNKLTVRVKIFQSQKRIQANNQMIIWNRRKHSCEV